MCGDQAAAIEWITAEREKEERAQYNRRQARARRRRVGPAGPRPKAGPDREMLASLVEMGYGLAAAESALQQAGADLARALDLLSSAGGGGLESEGGGPDISATIAVLISMGFPSDVAAQAAAQAAAAGQTAGADEEAALAAALGLMESRKWGQSSAPLPPSSLSPRLIRCSTRLI